jgi:hypothetical protein
MADWKKSVKLYGARSMTSSEIMIKTPITIAATAAARFSSARPALGQSDWSATFTRYNRWHRRTQTTDTLSNRKQDQLGELQWEDLRWLAA